jgi:hypothetical protein
MSLADAIADLWLWIADKFDGRPVLAVTCALVAGGFVAIAVAVFGV